MAQPMYDPQGWIPEDTFAARLALVRVRAGWTNVTMAATACEIDPQTWRNWESGRMKPRDGMKVCEKIAQHSGCDARWLAFGGALARSRWLSPLVLVSGSPVQQTLDFTTPEVAEATRPRHLRSV